mmetsp:Transcript_25830/g.80545  ORF Transcript_25830/g.80545 Transcript_25830/m.80545 type:complete len:414 (-) Transcript_25830:68-1309(-)
MGAMSLLLLPMVGALGRAQSLVDGAALVQASLVARSLRGHREPGQEGEASATLRHRRRSLCLQAQRAYLQVALGRLMASSSAAVGGAAYRSARIVEEPCDGGEYEADPEVDDCFPGMRVYSRSLDRGGTPRGGRGPLLLPPGPERSGVCDDGAMMSTASFVPDNGMACLQGPRAYVEYALARLSGSPLAGLYAGARVAAGPCRGRGFAEGPRLAGMRLGPIRTEECFPLLSTYFDGNASSAPLVLTAESEQLERFAASKEWLPATAEGDFLLRCDRGGHMAPLPVMPHYLTCGPSTAAGPCFSVLPDNGMCCMQGSEQHLARALGRLRASPLVGMYTNATLLPGPCEEHGYGLGPELDHCFPRLSLFMDIQVHPTHVGLMLSSEGEELRRHAASQGISLARAEELRKQACERE